MSKLFSVLSTLAVVGTLATANVPQVLAHTKLHATLRGSAISGMTPKGDADFVPTHEHGKKLTVSIKNINLKANTTLKVSACGTTEPENIIVLDKDRSGKITIVDDGAKKCKKDSLIQVMNGDKVILSGRLHK